MMDVHRQLRSETSGFAPSVSHQRHWAQDERRAQSGPRCSTSRAGGARLAPAHRCDIGSGTLVDQQREKLRRLPQSHVVGQARPETELAQKGEPRESTFLIRPELAGESIGRRSGLEPPVLGTGEQVAEPAVCRHFDDRQSPGPCSNPSADRRTSPADMTSPVDSPLPNRGDGGRELLAMQLHPLAAAHARAAASIEPADGARSARGVIAQYCFPADVTQPVETDGAGEVPPFEPVRALSRSPSLLLDERHHGGANTPNPASSKRGAPSRRSQDARSVHRVFAGSRRGESTSEGGDKSGSLTETAE